MVRDNILVLLTHATVYKSPSFRIFIGNRGIFSRKSFSTLFSRQWGTTAFSGITCVNLMSHDFCVQFRFFIRIRKVTPYNVVVDHLTYRHCVPQTTVKMYSTTVLKFKPLKKVNNVTPFS